MAPKLGPIVVVSSQSSSANHLIYIVCNLKMYVTYVSIGQTILFTVPPWPFSNCSPCVAVILC